MILEELKQKKTIIPAIATMLKADETFDEAAQRALVRMLLAEGADGFYVGGSTGEGPLLPDRIRRDVIRTVVAETAGRVPVIAYVGYIDTLRSIELAKYAEEVGADAVSSVPPYYYNFAIDNVVEFYADIADAVDIPLIVYYIPGLGGLKVEYFERLLAIPNVAGVKWTAPNHYELSLVKQMAGEKLVFSGMDEQFVSGIFMGADGVIGSTYNVAMKQYRELLLAYESGDLTKTGVLASSVNRLLGELLKGGNYLPSLKSAISHRGIGTRTMRRPFKTLTDDEHTNLGKRLLDEGVNQ